MSKAVRHRVDQDSAAQAEYRNVRGFLCNYTGLACPSGCRQVCTYRLTGGDEPAPEDEVQDYNLPAWPRDPLPFPPKTWRRAYVRAGRLQIRAEALISDRRGRTVEDVEKAERMFRLVSAYLDHAERKRPRRERR